MIIIKPAEMSDKEADIYVKQEQARWEKQGIELGKVELKIDGAEVIITASELSPIRRVRRITGYLSELKNFSDAKTAEQSQRVKHI